MYSLHSQGGTSKHTWNHKGDHGRTRLYIYLLPLRADAGGVSAFAQ